MLKSRSTSRPITRQKIIIIIACDENFSRSIENTISCDALRYCIEFNNFVYSLPFTE